jgi:hypothetical protein
MNATTDAKATAQTDLGWRHIRWLLLFCWFRDYFDRFAGPLRIVENPAQRADVFETAVAATPAATGKLRSRYVKPMRKVVKSAAITGQPSRAVADISGVSPRKRAPHRQVRPAAPVQLRMAL